MKSEREFFFSSPNSFKNRKSSKVITMPTGVKVLVGALERFARRRDAFCTLLSGYPVS